MKFEFWIFNWKINFRKPLVFNFLDIFINKSETNKSELC